MTTEFVIAVEDNPRIELNSHRGHRLKVVILPPVTFNGNELVTIHHICECGDFYVIHGGKWHSGSESFSKMYGVT